MNILEKIVEAKRVEIGHLYEQYHLQDLRERVNGNLPPARPDFYRALAEARSAGRPFFISEFKRKSPSEGWIDRDADLPVQILAYTRSGAGAISVLTDSDFFGGSYADLQLAAQTLHNYAPDGKRAPLLLQKDFILDPIQIFLARLHGADIILLIAAILEPEQLDFLKTTAESIGMGVLVEVHDADELAKIRHLDFPVLGINNRDLKTFRTALNRVNVLRTDSGARHVSGEPRFIIAESGVRDYRDFQALRGADGFLIGTGLMRNREAFPAFSAFSDYFRNEGRFLFKACGIRTTEMFTALAASRGADAAPGPDLIGINFSPVSKRRVDAATLEKLENTSVFAHAVAVFYQNTASEILEILARYPFRAVQLYAGDVTPAFVRGLRQRVLLAVRIDPAVPWAATFERLVEPFAADVDFFLLDGAVPGSGQRIGTAIPTDFPFPFLLAGGLNSGNMDAIQGLKNCIGVDIASGIETDGAVDWQKIKAVAGRLSGIRPD